MATEDDVKRFLDNFFTKLEIYQILFRDDRGKNSAALAELEITPNARIKVIK